MTNKVQYYSHLLLNSKYRLFYHFIIIFLIYITMYDNKVVFCMNENTNILEAPIVAEAKEMPSHQVLALKREIVEFAGTQAYLLETIDEQKRIIGESTQTINEQGAKITELTEAIEGTKKTILDYVKPNGDPVYKETGLRGYKNEIRNLERRINFLENQINQLNTSLLNLQKEVNDG